METKKENTEKVQPKEEKQTPKPKEQSQSFFDIQTSENIEKISEALVQAQAQMGSATKESNNPYFNSKYADLSAVINAIKQPMSKNNLSYVQSPSFVQNKVVMTMLLMHKSGQWIKGKLFIPIEKPTAQGVGSAITYARRYQLQSFLGIPAEDDDGNQASGNSRWIK